MQTEENTIKISLPDEVLDRLEARIIKTVERCLEDRLNKINAAPVLRTREETSSILKVTLRTLRTYEIEEKLIPKRSGRRVLYDQRDIDAFLGLKGKN